MPEALSNWAGNLQFSTDRVHAPGSLDEVREVVVACERCRVIGTRHSFNSIADSGANLISLERMDKVVELDRAAGTVSVEGGITYGRLCEVLEREGFALHNLASLPHISVAGACATATHGSGDRNGNLATAVRAMQVVTAGGELVTLTRESIGEMFDGAVVHLGGLGVVTQVTLAVEPTYQISQRVYEGLELAQLENNFDKITSSAYSVSLFTDWKAERFTQVCRKCREGDEEHDLAWALPVKEKSHPIPGADPVHCTEQLGLPGAWCDRLPHFRMEFTPSSGKELQSEYIVPRERALDAIGRVARLRERIAPLLQVCEIRTIAADTLWMSPCYRTPCVGIHFTWVRDWGAVRKLLPAIESELESCDARPHWGKLFTMPPEGVTSLYEKLADFRELLRAYDPEGKFRNGFMDTYVFGDH